MRAAWLALTCVHRRLPLHRRLVEFYLYREHLIIITELQGPDLLSHLLNLPEGPRGTVFGTGKLRTLARQMLELLRYLDEQGVTHCDLKTSNICLSPDLESFRLIDFGSTVLWRDEKNSYTQARWYRAPEISLGLPWDGKVDVWSLGCILAEVVVGEPLFRHNHIEAVLAAHNAIIGPIPEWMIMHTPALSALFFTAEGRHYQIDPTDLPKGAYLLEPRTDVGIRGLLAEAAEAGGYGDMTSFIEFVTSLLTIDPSMRPTAAEAMQHPWMTETTP